MPHRAQMSVARLGSKHRAAADVIGKSAKHEQRADEAYDVDREDDGQRGRRETPLLLVHNI